MTDFADTFDRHEIRDRVTAPHFGSWRLMRRTESGGWTGVFWCRITAADGLLRVSGDFDPIVFKGHLSHEDDPVSRVAWMGQQEGLTGYVCEKARSGSGRDACTQWSTDDAHVDLKELIAEASEEITAELEAEFEDYATTSGRASSDEPLCAGRVPEDSSNVKGLREYIAACQSGLDAGLQYDGREGVHEMLEAIRDSPHAIEMEEVYSIGVRPSGGLELAHLAVRRLHALLQAEARAESVRLAAEATAKVSEAALDLGEAVVGTSEAFETLRARLDQSPETYDVPKGASVFVGEDEVPCVLPGDDATKMTAAQVAANCQQHPQHGWRFGYSEGAVTFDTLLGFDTPQTKVVERLRAEQREYAIEQELDPDLCPCGNPGVCVGQYEGEVCPKLGCAECCNHEDFGECGRCWPLVREAGT